MQESRANPRLFLVIPCYNEEQVLPLTAPMFLRKLTQLIGDGLIAQSSRILFVDDGSRDDTWRIITDCAAKDEHVLGISLSRNRGDQNAYYAGLMEARTQCDIAVTTDCDGQDDPDAIDEMVRAYLDGADVVYGVHSDRQNDSFFKRFTAESYYRLLKRMGADVVFDHADFRLASARVLNALSDFHEVNLFLRGLFPMVGFRSTCVQFTRKKRIAGTTKYPLKRMLAFAFEGITSFSVKPIRLLNAVGVVTELLTLVGLVLAIVFACTGKAVDGWVWCACVIGFLSGLQFLAMGLLGEYIGKIYAETKARPRYIIAERTGRDNP